MVPPQTPTSVSSTQQDYPVGPIRLHPSCTEAGKLPLSGELSRHNAHSTVSLFSEMTVLNSIIQYLKTIVSFFFAPFSSGLRQELKFSPCYSLHLWVEVEVDLIFIWQDFQTQKIIKHYRSNKKKFWNWIDNSLLHWKSLTNYKPSECNTSTL